MSSPSKPLLCLALVLAAGLASAPGEEAPATLPLTRADPGKTGLLPDYTMILSQKAATAFAKKDWAAARAAYQEILKSDAENALAWANLGAVEQQAGRLPEARKCFEKSVRHNPALVQSWNALGLICTTSGDSYLAVSMFTRAIHEDPEDARAHNFLAIAMRNLGWTAAAESELQRAIALKPDYGIAHFNLALLYVDQKPPSIELARRHYQKALALGVEKDEVIERRLKE